MKRLLITILTLLLFTLVACGSDNSNNNTTSADNTDPDPENPVDHVSTLLTDVDSSAPAETIKITFIHHSTGSAWIQTSNGGLGTALNANNYYVTECDYGWDAVGDDNIGSRTDTDDWPEWFTDTIMPHVYRNNDNFDYTNTIGDPGSENDIIMFKSCYPLSEVSDSIDDEKQIYLDLLNYFEQHQDKMFILIVPPPEIVINSAELTRELTNWLVDYENGWLASYDYFNVHAFDYYNVLTDPNNHHRVEGSDVVHTVSGSPVDADHPNELYYYSGSNNHPTSAGHQKATAEYVPLLNAYYHIWQNN